MRIIENGNTRITENGDTRIEEFEDFEYPTSVDRITVISFPLNDNRQDITEGISSGTLYLNKLLFQEQFNPGECNSDRFEVTLFGVDDLSDETIQVYQLDYTQDPNNPVRTDVFYGVVDSCLKEDNGVNRKLVAYDPLYKIGNTDVTTWWTEYWDDTSTSTVADLFDDLLSTFNVTLSSEAEDILDSIPTTSLEFLQISGVQAITFGTVLAYIGQALMCNPHFNEQGELDLVCFGNLFNRSNYSVEGGYEDANSHFEDYTTAQIDRVVIYGETDVIAGSYGEGENVYVIKNNPLLYNLTNMTYNELARIIYDNLSGATGICYVPAKIKLILSNPTFRLGDIVNTPHGDSVVSAMELSGSLLIEQTLTSKGNQKLTPDDFNATNAKITTANDTANEALDQANLTSKHFVWVPNDGAYVTTDNIAAGQAPTQNYSKLTDTGLYVATGGKEVAHFGIDENSQPVSVLGSTNVGDTSLTISSNGMLGSKQITELAKSDYFSISTTDSANLYDMLTDLSLVVDGNDGYIDLDTSEIYLDAAYVMYSTHFNAQGYYVFDLTQTYGYYEGIDLALVWILDTVFWEVSVPQLDSNSNMRAWFFALFDTIPGQVSSRYAHIKEEPFVIDGYTYYRRIDAYFYNDDGINCDLPNVTKIELRLTTTVQGENWDFSAGNTIPREDYTFSTSDPSKITIINYPYYNVSASRTLTSDRSSSTSVTLNITNNTISWSARMLKGDVNYQATIGNSVDTNQGVNSIILGDDNTITSTSQASTVIAGARNTVDNDRSMFGVVNNSTFVVGNENVVNHETAIVLGENNELTESGNSAFSPNNSVLGYNNTITASSGNEGKNSVIGNYNEVSGFSNVAIGSSLQINDTERSMAVGQYNVAPSSNQFVIGTGTSNNDRKNGLTVTSSETKALGKVTATNSSRNISMTTRTNDVAIQADGNDLMIWTDTSSNTISVPRHLGVTTANEGRAVSATIASGGTGYVRMGVGSNGGMSASNPSMWLGTGESGAGTRYLYTTNGSSGRTLISADANNKLSGEVVSTLHLSEYDNNGLSSVHTAKKSSWTQFWSMSIPQGLWLIHGVVTFGSSTAGGYRGICLHTSGNTYSNVRDMTIVAPISGQNCIIDRWWFVPTTSTITRYINVANSTSNDISGVNCYLSMIRLGGYSGIDYA